MRDLFFMRPSGGSASAQVNYAPGTDYVIITGPRNAGSIRYTSNGGASWTTLAPATDLPHNTGAKVVEVKVEGAGQVFEKPVAPPAPIAAGSIPDQAWTVGTAVNLNAAADFTGTDITYALAPSSSALPAGLSISAAGVISGTPTAPGTGTIVVRGTNAGGPADSAFEFAVTAAGAWLIEPLSAGASVIASPAVSTPTILAGDGSATVTA